MGISLSGMDDPLSSHLMEIDGKASAVLHSREMVVGKLGLVSFCRSLYGLILFYTILCLSFSFRIALALMFGDQVKRSICSPRAK